MISSINSSVNSSYVSTQKSSSMSESQIKAINEILGAYDGDSLSSDDAKEIVEAFKELGIRPNAELKSVMEDAGFDAQEVGKLGGAIQQGSDAHGNRPPPPPMSYEEEVSLLEEILADILEDEEESSVTTQNQSAQLMDYTSRIMNLTDEAKVEVQELFEQFNTEDNDYTQKEISQIITDNLSEILGDFSNYKGLSVYA